MQLMCEFDYCGEMVEVSVEQAKEKLSGNISTLCPEHFKTYGHMTATEFAKDWDDKHG